MPIEVLKAVYYPQNLRIYVSLVVHRPRKYRYTCEVLSLQHKFKVVYFSPERSKQAEQKDWPPVIYKRIDNIKMSKEINIAAQKKFGEAVNTGK